MHLLYITPRSPWPADTGAKIRDFNVLRALAAGHEVHLISPEGDPLAVASDAAESPASFCTKWTRIARPKRYTFSKLIRGMLGAYPITAVNCQSSELTQAVKNAFSAWHFDAVHLDSVQLLPLQPVLNRLQPGVPVIFDWHNIDSEVMSRFSVATATLMKRLYAAHTAPRIAHMERLALKFGFGHLVCSSREAEIVSGITPSARVAVVPNGVDAAYFLGARSTATPRRLVFVGSMDYHPNIEAAVEFATQVWPAVADAHPDLTLTLVGARPVEAVRNLSRANRVEVTGTVETVRPYYADSLAAIVPLRTGGGTRLKILEAMAAGVPVVTTHLGAEGLEVEDRGTVLFAETPVEWLARIGELAANSHLRSSIAARAREFVQDRYDWKAIGSQLRALYSEWLTPAETSRQGNR